MRILVVEDEETIAAGLRDNLEMEGYQVEVVEDGNTAESLAVRGDYDLILLDVMLPGNDGFAVCRAVRSAGVRTPIIMLTAKGDEPDKVLGLELGADDYLTKPFRPRELLARVKAVLRRATHDAPPSPPVYTVRELTFDFQRFEARRKDRVLPLTALELRLVGALLRRRGQVVPTGELMVEVWGRDTHLSDRVIYTHINNLRGKIEADPSNPKLIVSVRGVGYRFEG